MCVCVCVCVCVRPMLVRVFDCGHSSVTIICVSI